MAEIQVQPHRSHEQSAGAARESAAPDTAPTNPILAAQHAVGNRAVQRDLRAGFLAPHFLLGQQATLGNQAVQRLLRRQPGPTPQPVSVPDIAGRLQRQTHHIFEPLDRPPRGRSPIVAGATLRQRSANAEAAGFEIVRQRRLNNETGVTETHTYARIPRFEPLTSQQTLEVNGVSLTVRNASEAEVGALRSALMLVPAPHLTVLTQRMRAIVLVDWTGAPDPNQRRLSGGANIERARDSTTRHHARYPEDDIGEPAGNRIEVTHTSMLTGGQGTLLHETGHVVYNAGLIPRRVHRTNYGSSVHPGESEQPAYAYMRFLQGGDLDSRDRAAFAARFREQGIPLPGGRSAAPATEGAAQRQLAGSTPTTLERTLSPATIQRSPLSDDVTRIWRDSPADRRKGAVFDRLRAASPAPADADLTAVLTRIFATGSDDLWLAQMIQQHGPEPLWPAALLTERRQHAGASEPGHIRASLATSAGGRPIDAFFFPGRTDERALIISGVHGSELSGIQVAERLLDVLRTGPRPHFTIIIVPRLFPDNAAVAESQPAEIGSAANVGRHTASSDVDPNRQFPQLGQGFDPATPVDARGRPIEPENIALLELIDRFRPSRIASLHAVRDPDVAGIFADPRTDAAGRALGYDEDERMALAMARHAQGGGANVPANRLGRRRPNAVYPRDPAVVAAGRRQRRDTRRGVSLGGWGATEVRDAAHPERDRPAMTVITIEVQTARRVGDVAAGEQAARQREIEAHAAALREIFLGPPGPASP